MVSHISVVEKKLFTLMCVFVCVSLLSEAVHPCLLSGFLFSTFS